MTNPNADDYAGGRLGIFFPGNPSSLTGQCVSLNKWFLAEMTGVPSPQSARGHAKDFGQTLVNQGHATAVAEANRRRGDIVVWKQDGGGYGHTGILLSGDRVFEQNVGLSSSTRGVFEGNVVYASRIDPLYQTWRRGSASFYRVNSYQETTNAPVSAGAKDMTPNFIRRVYYMVMNASPSQAEVDFHMAKSNPESFVNGFGDTPLWLAESRQIATLNAQLDVKPTEIIKEVIKEVEVVKDNPAQLKQIEVLTQTIKDNEVEIAQLEALPLAPVNFDSFSIGELLSAAFKKTFKIK